MINHRTLKGRRGAVPPCGFKQKESNPAHSSRFWRCEGSMIVLRGDGVGYSDGSLLIEQKDCPNCGWKTRPWNRVFAPPTCDGTADQCVEWSLEDQKDIDDTRGGGGDELEYDTCTDTFRFALGSGPGPQCYVSNPRPDNPAEGAKIVYRMADVTWE